MGGMTATIRHMKSDPYAAVVNLIDRSFLLFYRQVRRNANRITRLAVALLPMMALLVGSCKTEQLPLSFVGTTAQEQFRAALFPDHVNFHGAVYHPAAGYVSRARSYIESDPEAVKMLTANEVRYVFGKPDLRRQDADAEVWQYKTDSCVMDLYFYGHGEISYVDVRTKDELTPGTPPGNSANSSGKQADCMQGVGA